MAKEVKVYRMANLITGTIILANCAWWLYQSFSEYYVNNFTVVRCGVGQLPNKLIFFHVLLTLIGMALGVKVIEGKLRPFFGAILQVCIVITGTSVWIVSGA